MYLPYLTTPRLTGRFTQHHWTCSWVLLSWLFSRELVQRRLSGEIKLRYLCADVCGQIDVWFHVQEALNIAVLWWGALEKMELFLVYSFHSLWIYSIVCGDCEWKCMAHFRIYSLFNKKRYTCVRENWRVGVQPCIFIILVESKIRKEFILAREGTFAPNSKWVKILTKKHL